MSLLLRNLFVIRRECVQNRIVKLYRAGHYCSSIIINELPAEVPLFPHRIVPERQRLVHSVAVSLDQRLLALSGASCSVWSSSSWSPITSGRNLKRYYSTSNSTAQVKLKMPTGKPFERLPVTVSPKHYVISLTPDLKSLTFQGTVDVQIEVLKPTNSIVLNSVELQVDSATLNSENNSSLKPKSIDFSVEDETVTLAFEKQVSPGSYTLGMSFKGELNDKMKGLYRSKYINESGEERYAAVTQFESTDARRCFPCWDEPAIKATFDISLQVPKNLVALSNMPVKSKNDTNNGLIRYDFETTPIMSTYLVAVVVGEYDYVEGKSSDGVLVRVYTPKGKKEQGLFALEVATKVLPYYKEYFNVAYPLPKMDLIAIADFSAGAMENWGLVTYRETCLLVDPQNTSAVQKQWIALVVGHELAHQWFGNLVTMEWWTHLWLNEGYASFVEYLCVDHLFPEYEIWTQFVNDTYIKALELDCLKNSHPIEVPVGHPSEIDEIFDDISYNKGASVIRMLHNYIGDDDFRKGMNIYLTRHQYGNTFTEDLWAALEEASKKPVGEVMSTWTKQMGFPVVKVTIKEQNNSGTTLTLSQTKYTADGSKPSENYLWMIPISISTSKNTERISTVLKTKEADIFIPNVSESDWMKINPGTVGFYRTQYEPKLLERFIPAIKDRSLPPLDRLGLLDDLFAMVQAGHSNTVEVLKLLEAFEDETNYTVWSSINNVLAKLAMLLSYTDCADAFRKYQIKILSKVSKRLGWNPRPGEKHLDTLLRGLVLGRLSWLDDEETINEAKKRFEVHVNSSQILPADLRSACYKTVLRAGGEEVYESLLKLYRSVDLHEEKDRISRALGAAKNPGILEKVLKFAISDEVRAQDTVFVIISVAITKVGRDLAWQFFLDNVALFEDRYKGYLLTRLIKYVAENFGDEKRADEVEEFFRTRAIAGTERTVQQAVETIRLNAAWLARDTDAIRKYLGCNQ